MKSFIKITTIWLVINFSSGLFGGIVLGPKWNRIAQHYGGPLVGTLTVEARNIFGDAIADLTFVIPNGYSVNKPWIVSNQYIKVAFNCNYPSWVIKIVTYNKDKYPGIWGNPIKANNDADGDGDKWDGPPEENPLSDDSCSYGGLVYTADLEEVTYRASLGWRIYNDKLKFDAKPGQPADSDLNNGTPDDPNDDWKSKWAYIVDKGDTEYNDNIILGYSVDEDGDFLTWYNYQVAVFGDGTSGAQEKNGLAQHPPNPDTDTPADKDLEPDAKYGDNEVAIYVAARFSSKDYTVDPANPNGVDFVLPKGAYQTRIYLELAVE